MRDKLIEQLAKEMAKANADFESKVIGGKVPAPCPEYYIAEATIAVDYMMKRYKPLVEAAKEFNAKVDRGEARSKRSYAAFDKALSDLEAGEVVK